MQYTRLSVPGERYRYIKSYCFAPPPWLKFTLIWSSKVSYMQWLNVFLATDFTIGMNHDGKDGAGVKNGICVNFFLV